jgi:hypothetical protein
MPLLPQFPTSETVPLCMGNPSINYFYIFRIGFLDVIFGSNVEHMNNVNCIRS